MRPSTNWPISPSTVRRSRSLTRQAEPVEVALNTIFNKYANQAREPFVVGKDDLSRADEVKSLLCGFGTIRGCRQGVGCTTICHLAKLTLDAQLDDLKWKQENSGQLRRRIGTMKCLLAMPSGADYDQLLPLVADIENRAMAARQTGDLSDPGCAECSEERT
ncbi:unnamed protein product, partial [Mesorhabditis spiculigera]